MTQGRKLVRVEAEEGRHLLRMTLTGFLTVEDIWNFETARARMIEMSGFDRSGHVALCDLGGLALQSQDVIRAIQQMQADDPYPPLRAAIVTAGAAIRMQARRACATAQCKTEIFVSAAEAEQWLFGDGHNSLPWDAIPSGTAHHPHVSR